MNVYTHTKTDMCYQRRLITQRWHWIIILCIVCKRLSITDFKAENNTEVGDSENPPPLPPEHHARL